MIRNLNMSDFNKQIILLLTFIISLLLFPACSPEPDNIMNKDKFITVLSEVMIIEKLSVLEETKIALLKKVFEKHNTDAEEFLRTKEYYKQDPDYWINIYDKAVQRIKKDSDQSKKKKTDTKQK